MAPAAGGGDSLASQGDAALSAPLIAEPTSFRDLLGSVRHLWAAETAGAGPPRPRKSWWTSQGCRTAISISARDEDRAEARGRAAAVRRHRRRRRPLRLLTHVPAGHRCKLQLLQQLQPEQGSLWVT